MSSSGSAVATARSVPAEEAPAPAPLIGDTGSPGLNAVADVVNSTAEPFQNLMNPELGTAAKLENGINAVTGAMGAVADLVDTGFAVLTAPIAALFPALPAITLLGMHIGPPHTHTHPPSLIPPAPPVPLPSIGVLLGAGAVTVMIGGIPAARCGDIGISVTCGSLAPPFEVYTGSSNVFIGGSRAARMGDITKHCDPTSGGAPGAMDIIMNIMAFTAGALGGNPGAMAQAAAETAVLALKAIMGKDPGLPMLPGVLVGPPVPNVLIGGFPCPALGDMASGALMGGLKKALGKGLGKLKGKKGDGGPSKAGEAPPRKPADDASDGSSKAQRDANGEACNGTHPVYLVTGENFDQYLDFDSGGLFKWRRHYTSARGREGGPLGHGWRHSYQCTLRRRLHRATFTDWDGLRTEFDRFELRETTTRSNGYVLERLGRGRFRVKYRGRPTLEFAGREFDNELRLSKVIGHESELELGYDRLERLTTFVETKLGASARVAARERQPTNDDASAERHTTDDVERRRYELRLDAQGHLAELWEVDAGGRRAGGPALPALRASYQYSPASDLVLARDALEGQATYEYDSFHRLTRQSDARGYAYTYRYDASGRCIEASGQDGLWACKIEYHPAEKLTRYTEAGATWEYHYESSGVVTKIVDPYGGERTRSLDDAGRMWLEADSGGRTLEWLYDANGAHFARLDRFGNLFPPEVEQPKLPNPFARELPSTSLGWLFAGRIEPAPEALLGVDAAEIAALPAELQGYARGCFRVPYGEGPPPSSPAETRAELDALGRKIREVDALGRKREWRYDATGNLIASIDRDGHRSTNETTSWNLLGTRSDPLGNGVQYKYSSTEQIVSITDPLGNESRYDYDLKQRLVRVHRHGVLREEYVYDQGDHFVEKRDGEGNVLFTNTIHANHFVEKRTLASGGFHLFDYDAKGRIVLASTEAHEVNLRHASSGRRLSDTCDGVGVEHVHAGFTTTTRSFGRFSHAVRFEANAIQLVHGSSGASRIERTSGGLVKRRCANGTTEVLQFSEAGQLEASLRYRNGRLGLPDAVAARYSYTPEGDLIQIADSERGTSQFEVDAAHRLLAEHTPDGYDHYYALDAAGNLHCRPGLTRIELGSGNRLLSTTRELFAYDSRNHLAERTSFEGLVRDAAVTRYHYDSFDMLVRIERSKPETPGWLARLQDPAAAHDPAALDADRDWHAWSAEYDALGRRLVTRWSAPGAPERQRRFYWDGDRLAAEIFPDSKLRIYQYATLDALVPLAFTDYASVDAAPESGRTYHVFVNPVGVPLCIEDQDGKTVWYAARIDPYGAVELGADTKIEYNLRWPGHYFDPETDLHYNRYRYYDPKLGRYLQSDPIGHEGSPINLYAYCPNPLVQVDVLGLDHDGKPAGNGEDGPHPNKGKEGTTPPKLRGVSDATIALAASPGTSKAHIKARKLVAKRFYKQHGKIWDPNLNGGRGGTRNPTAAEARPQLKGIDYSKPVTMGPPPATPDTLDQWQRPGGRQGQFYAEPGTSPGELGIHDKAADASGNQVPKVNKPYAMNQDGQPYMKSTAAPIKDTWSNPGHGHYAPGGGSQYYVPNQSSASPAPPASP